MLGIWEFIREYMESTEAELAALSRMAPIYMPIHDRKEGFVFGVARTFANVSRWPWLHLVFSLPYSFIGMARWLAMTTSRIPVWPAEVHASSAIKEDDPLRRDWRDNPPLGFVDDKWPLICTAIGVLTAIWILYTIEQALDLRY